MAILNWCGVILHWIIVLICISLIIGDVEHLFMCFCPSVCLLWRNIYLDLPIFWLHCFLTWAYVFWRLIPCQSLCKCFLSFCWLSFHFVYGFFCYADTFNFVPFVFVFIFILEVDQKRNCCHLSKGVLPMFFSKSFIVSSLTFRFWSILSLFLYMVLENVLIWFFHV